MVGDAGTDTEEAALCVYLDLAVMLELPLPDEDEEKSCPRWASDFRLEGGRFRPLSISLSSSALTRTSLVPNKCCRTRPNALCDPGR